MNWKKFKNIWKNYQYIIMLFISIVICVVTHFKWNSIISIIKLVFSIPNLNFWAGGFALILSLLVRMKENEISLKNHIAFNDFKQIIEEIFSYFAGGSITLICSISLAKGLFLQWRGVDTYFMNFEQWELIFIFLITLYLLFISLREVVRDFVKLLPNKKGFTPQPIEKPEGG